MERTTKRFEVWAPGKKLVELILDSASHPMQETERGYWATEVEVPTQGVRYWFRLDGEGPYPDPRSHWQPEGVHGPSETVDHSAFVWHDHHFVPKPMRDAVLYELHVGTFSPEGTYEGLARRLPHLVDLGVTHIELLPLNTFPGRHGWGYDGATLFAPHPAYGTPTQLKALVERAHELGLAMVLDVVYNHFGPDGTYAGKFGPYHTDHHHTPWGDAVNFDDRGSDGVREFVRDNALHWLRNYHFDGLRIDAVHAIHDESAVHVLELVSGSVLRLSEQTGRPYTLIGESDLNAPRLVLPRAFGGYGLDAHWQDDFHHALHAYFTGEREGIHADFGSLEQIAKALRQGYVYDGQYSTYRRCFFGRPPTHVLPWQLVVFSQNHDQTGNRARGERLRHILEEPEAKAVAALVLLSPFTPMLFQGEEWGASTPFLYFSDHEPELGKLVAEGRRADFSKFGWAGSDIADPQAPDTFERSKLQWQDLEEPVHRNLLEWHRALVAIRRKLRQADTSVHGAPAEVGYDEGARWLTMRRHGFLLMLNLSEQGQEIPVPQGAWSRVLASHPEATVAHMPPRSTLVARLEEPG